MSDIRSARLAQSEYDTNFGDMTPTLSRQDAIVESSRCYFCYDAPCVEACPTSIDIPSFIRKIQTGNLEGSATTILESNILGGTCARVCPTEILCEEVCVRQTGEGKPVKIGQLQQHAVEWLLDHEIQPFAQSARTGKKIAVVGSGPAGLACAHGLARQGHEVTVFEQRTKAGGLNEYGIAAYKMAGEFAQREVEFILGVGGINLQLEQSVQLEDVVSDFDAVFIGCGLGETNSLGLENEDAGGVVDAVDFIATLRQSSKRDIAIGRHVVVVGGGNTAIDAAIQSKRLGAEEVTLVYRRGPDAMSATSHEQELAKLNGVIVRYWARPAKIIAKKNAVIAIEFERTQLDIDNILIGTSETYVLRADQVMKAIGQKLAGNWSLEMASGKIAVDIEGRTSMPKVWAGGDATLGDDLTVSAVEDGKCAAASIHRFLQG